MFFSNFFRGWKLVENKLKVKNEKPPQDPIKPILKVYAEKLKLS